MKPIDIIGLKNFRVFDDANGLFEELALINILTGANNSGKSSIVKFLQMLKNSTKESQYPFDLDLTQQEHLLGDFDNILFNKENKDITISLPFPFLGIKTVYLSLLFTIPTTENAYHAKLRKIDLIDTKDNTYLFSFTYRSATDAEKDADEKEFLIKTEEYKKNKAERKKDEDSYGFSFPPFKNPIVGYIKWKINLESLKFYLKELFEFYKIYLKKKNERNFLVNADKVLEDSWFIPSILIDSFKREISIDIWANFLEEIKDSGEITETENIREGDFESDYFSPPPSIEEVFYDKVLRITRENINWMYLDGDRFNNSIIAECFKSSWDTLLQRISTINYLSNIKEENSRIYNATINSPFINLLKEYISHELHYSRCNLPIFRTGCKYTNGYRTLLCLSGNGSGLC